MALINCSDCGKIVSSRAEACLNCGCPVKTIIEENENYNKAKKIYSDKKYSDYQTIAFIFGPFGIHNFYIGRNIVGTFQLVIALIILLLTIFAGSLIFWIFLYAFAWYEAAFTTKDSDGLLLQKKGF